jgi:hypothetical protein
MSQTSLSGAQASSWGLRCGRALAALLGASNPPNNSNKCQLIGQMVVMKCAHFKNDKVGVSYHMLKELDAVIGAFEDADGKYDVWSLSSDIYHKEMTGTRSTGRSAGKVGVVTKRIFQTYGSFLGRFEINADA